jgi:hypothetical protein
MGAREIGIAEGRCVRWDDRTGAVGVSVAGLFSSLWITVDRTSLTASAALAATREYLACRWARQANRNGART